GAEPVPPGGQARGGGRGRALPGLGRGRVGQRHHHRPQRGLLPALTGSAAGSAAVPAAGPAVAAVRAGGSAAVPAPAVPSGASHSTPSGGTLIVAEAGRPWCGSPVASIAPRLPTPLPP